MLIKEVGYIPSLELSSPYECYYEDNIELLQKYYADIDKVLQLFFSGRNDALNFLKIPELGAHCYDYACEHKVDIKDCYHYYFETENSLVGISVDASDYDEGSYLMQMLECDENISGIEFAFRHALMREAINAFINIKYYYPIRIVLNEISDGAVVEQKKFNLIYSLEKNCYYIRDVCCLSNCSEKGMKKQLSLDLLRRQKYLGRSFELPK